MAGPEDLPDVVFAYIHLKSCLKRNIWLSLYKPYIVGIYGL